MIVCELHDLPGIQFKADLAAQARKLLPKLSRYHRVVHAAIEYSMTFSTLGNGRQLLPGGR
jgi:hypothetical protein